MKQKAKLILEGKFLKAEEMDLINVIRKTGVKYLNGVCEKLKYDERLLEEGKING